MDRRSYPTGLTAAERREYLEKNLRAGAAFRPSDAIALEELTLWWKSQERLKALVASCEATEYEVSGYYILAEINDILADLELDNATF